jgi:lipid-binding SYLF domain-containing protein
MLSKELGAISALRKTGPGWFIISVLISYLIGMRDGSGLMQHALTSSTWMVGHSLERLSVTLLALLYCT